MVLFTLLKSVDCLKPGGLPLMSPSLHQDINSFDCSRRKVLPEPVKFPCPHQGQGLCREVRASRSSSTKRMTVRLIDKHARPLSTGVPKQMPQAQKALGQVVLPIRWATTSPHRRFGH